MARPSRASVPESRPAWVSVVLGGLGFVVAGFVLWWAFGDDPPPEAPEGMVVDEDGELVDGRVRFESDRVARQRAARPHKTPAALVLRTLEGAGPGTSMPSDLQGARDTFDGVMTEVELLAERPRAMRQRRWQGVYRAANDAFTALSMELDATDRTEAKELEAAHKRLVEGLSILRVRGGKFKVR